MLKKKNNSTMDCCFKILQKWQPQGIEFHAKLIASLYSYGDIFWRQMSANSTVKFTFKCQNFRNLFMISINYQISYVNRSKIYTETEPELVSAHIRVVRSPEYIYLNDTSSQNK